MPKINNQIVNRDIVRSPAVKSSPKAALAPIPRKKSSKISATKSSNKAGPGDFPALPDNDTRRCESDPFA